MCIGFLTRLGYQRGEGNEGSFEKISLIDGKTVTYRQETLPETP